VSNEEPEASLTRAALVMVLGAALVGLSLEDRVEHGAISLALFVSGSILMAGAVLATLQRLYQHWKDNRR
jgi:hypothetical protein